MILYSYIYNWLTILIYFFNRNTFQFCAIPIEWLFCFFIYRWFEFIVLWT